MIPSEPVLRGIDNIFISDAISQKTYISNILKLREGTPEDLLERSKSFFLPNNEYLGEHIPQLKDPYLGFYDFEGFCSWNNHLMIPLKLLNGNLVGFCGFDILNYAKKQAGELIQNYYKYPNKNVFHKGRYLFIPEGDYELALNKGYIFCFDGTFDSLHTSYYGYPSCSFLGSNITQESFFTLRFIETLYVPYDNDKAGAIFLKTLEKLHKNVVPVLNSRGKDSDFMLRYHKDEYLEYLSKVVQSKNCTIFSKKLTLFD